MTLTEIFSLFTRLDAAALTLFVLSWLLLGLRVETSRFRRSSVAVIMARYRREWMLHHIRREPRVFDAMILASLREGTAFFASACMIALGGGLALIGNTERLASLTADFPIEGTALTWEIKLLVPLILVTNAFLKFVWSNRVFGYCSVMMGSIPNDVSDPQAERRARRAGMLNIEAAKAFNRGLRSTYFALGSLAWLLGAVPFIMATSLTALTIWHREFASKSRRVLLEDPSE
ncbi:MAG: DUF599 domain-containing protein [Mangrovicoccus sp.]